MRRFPNKIQLLVTTDDILRGQKPQNGDRCDVCPVAQSAARRFALPAGVHARVGNEGIGIDTKDQDETLAYYPLPERVKTFIRRADNHRRLQSIRFTVIKK